MSLPVEKDVSGGTDELCFLPAWRQAELIRGGEISAPELVDAVLARVERLNPALNAFVLTYPERSHAAAEAAMRALRSGEPVGPLHGVPVSIKDTYWSNGVPMRFGSQLMANHVPQEDSPPVIRLREAGTVDIGKTNTPEFAWRGSTDNRLHGATVNPWNLGMTAGGSSGGAAAAVAAGLGGLAMASDAAGSIRIPASFCGLVGFKATYGRVAMFPPAGGNELALHGGPIARTVRDAALMYQAIAWPDPRDPYSLPRGEDVVAKLDTGIAGLRVAYSPDLGFAPVEPETAAIAAQAARAFDGLGVKVEESSLALTDPSWILDTLFGGSLAGVHASRPAEEKSKMDPALVAYAEKGAGISIEAYMKAVIARQALVQQLVRYFDTTDLLLTPAVGLPAFPVGLVNPAEIAGRPTTHLGWSLGYPFNWSGQPAITVPAGWTKAGLPVGLQIVGRRLADAMVLRAAAAFEEVKPWADRWPACGVS
jgi:aspartyl-tRNA(Asn)/glutamyl-tRNA(Gln) amidotransferase subunit A